MSLGMGRISGRCICQAGAAANNPAATRSSLPPEDIELGEGATEGEKESWFRQLLDHEIGVDAEPEPDASDRAAWTEDERIESTRRTLGVIPAEGANRLGTLVLCYADRTSNRIYATRAQASDLLAEIVAGQRPDNGRAPLLTAHFSLRTGGGGTGGTGGEDIGLYPTDASIASALHERAGREIAEVADVNRRRRRIERLGDIFIDYFPSIFTIATTVWFIGLTVVGAGTDDNLLYLTVGALVLIGAILMATDDAALRDAASRRRPRQRREPDAQGKGRL